MAVRQSLPSIPLVWLLPNAGKVDAVAVGADRIAANGDTANKIGTLQLAIAAAHYGIPFLVVAPLTSCDPEVRIGRRCHRSCAVVSCLCIIFSHL